MSDRKTIRPIPAPKRRTGALTYEIRIRVPDEAQGGRFGTHTSRTLGTRDKAEAYEALPAVWQQLQNEFADEALRLSGSGVRDLPAPKPSAPAAVLTALPILSLDEICRMYREMTIQSAWCSRQEHLQWIKTRPVWEQPDPQELARRYEASLDEGMAELRARLTTCDLRSEQNFLKSLETSGRGTVVDRDGACIALAMADLQARTALRDDFIATRLTNEPNEVAPPVVADQAAPLTAQTTAPITAPLLSGYLQTYLSRKKLSVERGDSLAAVVRDLIGHIGDRPVDAYTATDGASFVGLLLSLPANWRKSRALRHLSLAEAAAKAVELALPCQAPKTIRKKLAQLGALFRAAKGASPGVQITFPLDEIPSSSPANDAKHPFTVQELQKLFDSDMNSDLRWISLISLFCGARSNEIAQLTRSHVHQHGAIWYISTVGMRLKTGKSSLRSIPIHRQLLDLGLINLIESKKDKLFPDLTQHSSGRYSDAVGKRFTHQLKKVGIKRPKLSFHSLRHTFEARLKVTAPRDAEVRERIAGHALKGEASRYGDSYEAEAADMDWLKVKADVLDTLRWPGLILT